MDTQTPPSSAPEMSPEQIRNIAAISYIWILSVPVFLFGRRVDFVRHHAFQGLVLFLLSVAIWWIPYVNYIAEIALALGMLLGYYRASRGEDFSLFPVTHTPELWRSHFQKAEHVAQTLFVPTARHASASEMGRKELSLRNMEYLAAFSYLWILSIPILKVFEKEAFIASHARQGVVLFLLSLLFLPLGTLGFYLNMVLIMVTCFGFLSALSGKSSPLPIVAAIGHSLSHIERLWCHVVGVFLFLRPGNSNPKRSYRECTAEWAQVRSQTLHALDPETNGCLVGVFCYFFFGPFLLFAHRENRFVRFHAEQGIFLNILLVLSWWVAPHLPSLTGLIAAAMVYGAVHAHLGKSYPLPLAHELIVVLQKIPRSLSRTRAFTLVEIVIATAIIAVLIIGLVSYAARTDDQEVQLEKKKMELIREQVESFKVKNGTYPTSIQIQTQPTSTP